MSDIDVNVTEEILSPSDTQSIGDSNDSSEEMQGAKDAETSETEEVSFDGQVISSIIEEVTDNSTIRKMREELRRKNQLIEELSSTVKSPQTSDKEPLRRPTYEDCQYDEALYAEKMEAYMRDRVVYEKQQAEIISSNKKKEEEALAKLNAYNAAKSSVKFEDYELVESEVARKLDQSQIGAIILNATRPEYLIYALGKNPAKLEELAAIKDPWQYIYKLAKMEELIKVSSRKTTPAPEKVVSRNSASVDLSLEKALKEFKATGDATNYLRVRAEKQMQDWTSRAR